MPIELQPEVAARIAARLPDGYNVENLRIVTARAEIVPESPLSESDRAIVVSQLELAGGPPRVTDGVPTVTRIVAWLAHEGINNNRLAFVADELGPAADRIREPNFLLMDWNHSAVRPFSMDEKAIGVWFRAEKRWDPRAKAYGIQASGTMWAWAFPSYATEMLAEQERNGFIEFSMACVPGSVEIAIDADGKPYEIAHNPTFLTLSALDVPAADRNALGRAVEGDNAPGVEERLTQELMAAAATNTEEQQMKELQDQITALQEQLSAASAKIETLTAAETKVAELSTALDAEKTKSMEANTAKDALATELAAARAELETMKTSLDAANARLAEIDAQAEAATKKARYEARLAEMPEAFVDALKKRTDEEQTRFATKWTSASDEEFADFKKEIETAFSQDVKLSYQARSNREGGALPNNGGAPADDVKDIIASIKK